MSGKLLRVEQAKAGYGRVQVLHGISIDVKSDGNVGLFGPNGHGKTTLLRLISGLVRPTSGKVLFQDVDITGAPPSRVVDQGLIHVPQGNLLFPNLTISETLQLGAHRTKAQAKAKESLQLVIEVFPKLGQRYGQRVSTLSGGERQMVSIGMALMNDPTLLILDEPTLGLSPKVKEELCGSINTLSDRGIPLVVVEQDIEFLLTLAKRLYFINHGEASAPLSADDRLSNKEIMEMYFGEASP
jgi:branched-chain amino acid transport system ATP-binding protein